MQDLDKLEPGLTERFLSAFEPIPMEEETVAIPFRFNVVAAATTATRDEFIAAQKAEAARLRDRILADPDAKIGMKVLAADANQWASAYIAALEQAVAHSPGRSGRRPSGKTRR